MAPCVCLPRKNDDRVRTTQERAPARRRERPAFGHVDSIEPAVLPMLRQLLARQPLLRRSVFATGRPLLTRSLSQWPITRDSSDRDQQQRRRQLSTETPPKKPTRWQQLKTTFREHGPVFVGYYATTWLGGFGVCWGAVSVAGLDGVALLKWLGADMVLDTSALSPQLINALIAAEINELFDFVRLPIVIATTPALSRRLRGVKEEAKEEAKPEAADPSAAVKSKQKGG